MNHLDREKLVLNVIGKTCQFTWWLVSDINPKAMYIHEILANFVYNETKACYNTNYRLKRATFGELTCEKCDLGIEENALHLVVQCPHYEQDRLKCIRN